MWENLLLLYAAALPLMGSPGPATLSLAGFGAAFGFRRSGRYLSGIILGTCFVLILIATGVTGLILAVPALVVAITAVAAFYILYLAFRIATAPPISRVDNGTQRPSFLNGLLLAVSNPKAFAAIGAVFASRQILTDSDLLDAGVKVLALSMVVVAVNVGWLAFGTGLSSILTHPTASRIANLTFAGLLLLSVGLALWDLAPPSR